jgi:hypothetical protein
LVKLYMNFSPASTHKQYDKGLLKLNTSKTIASNP